MIDILIVEDNLEIGTLLSDFLVADGYSVYLAESGEKALSYFEDNNVKLVILDIMLTGIDGFAVCSKLREHNNTPILIVSALVNKEDKLNGLLLGADDYIEKPYDIDILLAKIKGIFSRRYDSDFLIDKNIKLDKQNKLAYCNEVKLNLTSKEFDLLSLFMKNKSKVLKKDYIFNTIWGLDSFSEAQTLTVHVKWLREKIEDDPKNPKRLLTVWGTGYRFE